MYHVYVVSYMFLNNTCKSINFIFSKTLKNVFLQEKIDSLVQDGFPIFEMSTLTGDGVMELRNEACDRLLAHRVDSKLKGKKAAGILNRLEIAQPKPRDDKVSQYILYIIASS